MSIQEALEELERKRVIRRLTPTDQSRSVLREVYVNREVDMFLSGSKGVRALFLPASGPTLAVFDAYMAEKKMTFGMDPHGKGPGAIIARNAPIAEGVCDFRILAPSILIRVFGQFAHRNTFVASTYAARIGLPFSFAVARSRKFWNQHLAAFSPVVSENVHDYISEPVVIV